MAIFKAIFAAVALTICSCNAFKIQGTVRDFTESYFVGSTTASSTGTRSVNKNYQFEVSNYVDWFDTKAEEPFNALPKSIEFTASGGVMQYSSSSFYPADGMLYGNEGRSHNSFFTFFMDTLVENPSTTVLTFGATCSMWVGYCQASSCTTAVSWTNTYSNTGAMTTQSFILPSGTYRLWVAYAHHCKATPAIQIQIPNVDLHKRQCDVTTSPVVQPGLYPFTGTNINRKNVLSTSASTIHLLSSSQTDTATSVWHPTKLDVRRGFMASFKFAITSNAPAGGASYTGFAFVVQNDNGQAQGDAGDQLFDDIEKAIAVEFAFTSSSAATINIEHRYDGQSGYTSAGTSACSLSGSDAYIRYNPELTSGQLSVFFSGCSLSATVSDDSIFTMWKSLAYVGFTGGVSGADAVGLDITEWKVERLQASGAFTKLVTSGILFAQFGQHAGTNTAASTEMERVTDIVKSSYVSNGVFSVSTVDDFTTYDPFSYATQNQLELVYFQNETAGFTTITFDSADRPVSSSNIQLEWSMAYPTGAAKYVSVSSIEPSIPSYYIVPLDGCGNPAFSSAGTGLASIGKTWTGDLYTSNSTIFSCSNGKKISVKYSSQCGVDVTSTIAADCDTKTSCTPTYPACGSPPAWKQVHSTSYECYDLAPPTIQKTTSVAGIDAEASFGFYQEIYSIHLQQRMANPYNADVRFNGDSIGSFTAQFAADVVDQAQSSFISIGPALTAGTTYAITLSAYDQFSNPVNTSDVQFTVDFDQIATSFTSTYVSGNQHTVSVVLTGAIATMQMYVRVASVDLNGSPQTISVGASNATTAFVNADSTLIATNSGGITATLSLQDAYGNSVTSGTVDLRAVIIGVSTYASPSGSASSFTSGQVVISNIRHNVVGAYVVEYYLNGVKLTATSGLTILPAGADVPSFALTNSSLSYSVGGDANFFSVQTRDQFGNPRTSTSTPFEVEYSGPSSTTVTVTCPSAQCAYFSQGTYRAYLTPTLSGAWSVKAQTTGGGTSTGSISFTVLAGAVSSNSELSVSTFSVGANQSSTFTITSKDSSGNVRSHTDDDGSSFVVSIMHLGNSRFASVESTSMGSSGVYTVSWRAAFSGCAGSYIVSVDVSGGGTITNTTSRTVSVTPGATAQVSDLVGPGLQGGGAGGGTYFFFNAYDEYDNIQTSSVSNNFTLSVLGESASPSVSSIGSSRYVANYTIPAFVASSPQYSLRILLENAVVASLDATTVQSDSSANGATIYGLANVLYPDVPENFQINNRDFSSALTTQRTFFIDIVQGTTVMNSITPSCTTPVSPNGLSCNVTINSVATKHVTAVGTYTVKVRVGSNNYSPNNYSITIKTGTPTTSASETQLSTSAVQAGTQVTMSAILRDQYNNMYTEGTRTISFYITTIGSGQCSSGCTIPAMWNVGTQNYTASFTPINSTTYSIVAREGILELGTTQSLSVTPSAASAPQSSFVSVSPQLGFYAVDYQISATVDLKDVYGNPITGLTGAGGFPFTPMLSDNNISFAISETGTVGRYLITCTPTVSSTYTSSGTASQLNFTVKIGGANIGNSPRSFEVEPGNVDASRSSITTVPTSFTTGDSMALNFTLKDRHGNPWKQQIILIRFTISTPTSKYNSLTYGTGTNFEEPIRLGVGGYMFKFTSTEANVHLSYTFEYISSIYNNYTSVLIPGLNETSRVVSGPAKASQTIVTKSTSTNVTSGTTGVSPFAANFTAYTKLTLYDKYGNPRRSDSTGNANITVKFDGHRKNDYIGSNMPAAFICSSNMDYNQYLSTHDRTMNFTSTSSCDANSTCSISAIGPAAGNFRMLVFVNNIGAYCYQFTTNPGDPNPSGSTVTTVGTVDSAGTTCVAATVAELRSQTVGKDNCAMIQMADNFGNFLTRNVSQPVSLGVPSGTSYCANVIQSNSDFTVGSTTYLGAGQYMVQFSARTIGTFNLSATIGGEFVGKSYEDCTQISFAHWYVYAFTPTVDPISTYIGVPSTISISANDIFGNNVTSGNFYYSMTLSHYGKAYSVSDSRSTAKLGIHDLDFTPFWDGVYKATITLTDPDYDGSQFTRSTAGYQDGYTLYINVTVISSTCAIAGSNNYRCSDDPAGQCASSYSNCSGLVVCSGSTPFMCPSSSTCVSNITSCPCSTPGTTRCENGICVYDTNTCVEKSLLCPDGYVNCASSSSSSYAQCAPTTADCPTLQVCPPGTIICDDGISCAGSAAACDSTAIRSNCTSGTYKCHDGRCVSTPFDCPTRKSCGTGMVVCSDGSCRNDSTMCPSQIKCYDDLIRCSDGTCASNVDYCPSDVTCPMGHVLCESGKCAESVSQCPTANTCSLSEVRCKYGSCVEVAEQCPTQVTCDSPNPVLCDDGTCVDSYQDCPLASELLDCNSAFGLSNLVTCPDGSCASSFATCSTASTCPKMQPVKCPDGSCQRNATICSSHMRSSCSSAFPVVCSDGSCRSDISQCPSYSRCPADSPVMCEDGACVTARSYCETVSMKMKCPDGQVRCALGCAPDASSCPSVLACPKVDNVLYQRCFDGTCRSSCSGVSYVGCSTNQVTCPSASTGYPSCVSNLGDCPTYHRCPVDNPVVCIDGTCVTDATQCPDWPTTFTKFPCADGGWQLSQGSCGTPVTCPNIAPYKCGDETCRKRPEDCVGVSAACPESKPYRCQTGDCLANIEDCPSTSKCVNPATYPVKCAAMNSSVTLSVTDGTGIRCTTSAYYCDSPFQSSTGQSIFQHDCPNRWTHCRDATCVEESSTLCEELSCPDYLSHRCEGGLCVEDATKCPVGNGCPYDRPVKCTGGMCVSRQSICNNTLPACTGSQVRCGDGSCSVTGSCPNSNGCPQGSIRCLDGSCVAYDSRLRNPGTNYCVHGEITDDYNNACPFFQPVRCPGGLCVVSETLCPRVAKNSTMDVTCDAVEIGIASGEYIMKKFAVTCSDGSCVDSEVQCPTLHACILGYTRCDDGSCRSDASSCPHDNTCPSSMPYRCTNGMCARSLTYCVSPTSETGCPCASTSGWDSNGHCSVEMQKCSSQVIGGLCTAGGVCTSQESSYPRGNGCNSTHTIKCWDGLCATAMSQCKGRNSCPAAMPVRCLDGTCQSTAASCSGRNAPTGAKSCANGVLYLESQAGSTANNCSSYTGCPVTTPYRCGDGSCMKYQNFAPSSSLASATLTALNTDVIANSCPAVLVCPSYKPYRCADYSCATKSEFCPPTQGCPDSTRQYICPDLTCAADATGCAKSCPANSPILCPDGSCRSDLTFCKSERIQPTCAAEEVLCFDGACRSSSQECIKFAYLVGHPSATSFTAASLNADDDVCPVAGSTKMAVCSDGSCVPQVMKDVLCEPITRCPASYPMRCPDSTCVTAATSCSAQPSCSDSSLTWCPDGTCRTTCLPSNGCSGNTPFFCPSSYTHVSFCVASQAACTAGTSRPARPQGLNVHFNAISSSNTPPTCTGNTCNRDVDVNTQVFTLNNNADSEPDIAVSSVDFSVRASLSIPAGAVQTTAGESTFQVEQVSDTELRSAMNYIHKSRQSQYSGVPGNMFTMEQTVLSPAFKCVASQDPFNLQITFKSQVDNRDLINPGSADKRDICLAIIDPDSASWVCVAEYIEERNNAPITNTTETRFVGRGTAEVTTCVDSKGTPYVYAFAHIPIQQTESRSKSNILYVIQVIVVMSVVGGVTIVLFILWFTSRAGRYRRKLKEVKKKTEAIDEEIQDMKMYEGGLGAAGKDEEINMFANPMVIKFKSLQDQLAEYKATTGYYETETKKQTAKIKSLEQNRKKLNDAIKKLKQELQEQHHRVARQKALREQQAAAEEEEEKNAAIASAAAINQDGIDLDVIEDEDSTDDDYGRDNI